MSESTMTIDNNGTKRWKNEDGELHRLDGPAVEHSDGTKYWYKNGKRHRIDGPAAEYSNGFKSWWQNGRRHREDGPAIELRDGSVDWYFQDERLGNNIDGFWNLWECLDEEQRQNVNLHMWLRKLMNV